MFPNTYSASFFYADKLLYKLPNTAAKPMPPPEAGAETVVICASESGRLTETEAVFLNNILKAVGQSPQSVQIIPLSASGVFTLAQAVRLYHPQKMLIFGFQPKQVQTNLSLPLYTPAMLAETQILLADSLNTLENNKAKKSVLWQQLKQMFGV